MATLLPNPSTVTIGRDVTIEQTADQPSRTFKINWISKRVEGYTDGREAIEQAIYKILFTERFAYLIYSWNYGFELNNLLGETLPIVEAEIARLIKEALTADERIEDVQNFEIARDGRRVLRISFEAVTKYGVIPFDKAVEMNV